MFFSMIPSGVRAAPRARPTSRSSRGSRPVRTPRRAGLRVEQLDPRVLPSAAPASDFLAPPDARGAFHWADRDPSTPNTIDIWYDFRPLNGYANGISPTEQALAVQAMQAWESASQGSIHFVRNTSAVDSDIVNIGIGSLAAVGDPAGSGVLGEGGASLTHGTTNGLAAGFAWLNQSLNWSDSGTVAPPPGTYAFLSVVAHEIGHAIGLGHDDNLGGANIMNEAYSGFFTRPSAADTAELQALYPPFPGVPTRLAVVAADAGQPPQVKVFDAVTGQLQFQFMAYSTGFTGGVRVAVGDVSGDGIPDVVTAPGPGGGPEIHVYDGRNGSLLAAFDAYDPNFRNGDFVAVGDVNGDGRADIITGADAGGGPHVKVFSGVDGSVLQSFYAFAPGFSGGVRVAAGDTRHTGHADVIVSPGAGGGPEVRVFDGATGGLVRDFYAYQPDFTGGVYVAAGDVNGEGTADIITGTGRGGGPEVKVFSGGNGSLLASYFAADPSFMGGVRVGSVVLADGRSGILTVTGRGGDTTVRVTEISPPTDVDHFFAFDTAVTSGFFVAGGQR